MKRLFHQILVILMLTITVSACSPAPDSVKGTESSPTATVVGLPSGMIIPSVTETILSASSTPLPTSTVDMSVDGDEELYYFTITDNGVRYPSGELVKAHYDLPGYKSVPINIEENIELLESVFEQLSRASVWDYSEEYAMMTGAILSIEYTDGLQTYTLRLGSHVDGKRVWIGGGPFDSNGSDTIISEELCQLIHELSAWGPFDIALLTEIDEMKIKVEHGIHADGRVVSIIGEELDNMVDLLVRTAVVDEESKCPFNVSVIMMKDGEEMYHGYLAGDSCPMFGIETQYFRVDKTFFRHLYEKIGITDMDII